LISESSAGVTHCISLNAKIKGKKESIKNRNSICKFLLQFEGSNNPAKHPYAMVLNSSDSIGSDYPLFKEK